MRALVEMPQLLTIAEAARVLRVHRNTVDRELRAGRLGCVRIGRRVLVRIDQLRQFVDSRSGDRGECGESLSTENTGWSNEQTRPSGMSTGADRDRDRYAAAARARKALKRPSSS
ncbi:MAG: helix-turn-helix domain-containing protein [Planctomycetes bacterium]|nr:helix-turn-helix domain-containing protein [Planctomycetota bacterium]